LENLLTGEKRKDLGKILVPIIYRVSKNHFIPEKVKNYNLLKKNGVFFTLKIIGNQNFPPYIFSPVNKLSKNI
jgi:hypothetical protein